MDTELYSIFRDSVPFHLIGLLTGAVLFICLGARELKDGIMQGALSVAFGLFLGAGHAIYLLNLPEESGFGPSTLSFMSWTIQYAAPTIMICFASRGLWDLIIRANPNGLIRLFWGTTLAGYLFAFGADWPSDLKVAVISFYAAIFLMTETDPADEPMLSAWRA